MKYIVMEVFDSYAVVLDNLGRFIKVANFHYTPGQEITDIFPMQEANNRESLSSAKLIPWKKIMAYAACFVIMATAFFGYINTPYASVVISINPSVRIDIDKNEMVKKVIGTNADGENLVQDYDYKGKKLDTTVDELVDMAIDRGYLYDGGKIKVTLEGENRWVQNNEIIIGEHINEYMQQKIAISIEVGENYSSNTQVSIPVTSYGESDYGITDYKDTDYSPENDGVTDYSRSDTDYASDNNNTTDYIHPPEPDNIHDNSVTDYESGTSDSRTDYSEGVTDYGAEESDDTPYSGNSDYENED